MKITSKKVDDLNQVLTVNVAADDYVAARKKKLADLQRKAEVPGFRKGKVPASLIEKWYGDSALADAVNNVVGESLQNYIAEKKLDIIGEPLPCEEKVEQDWKAGNDFVFKFDVAISPKVSIALDKTDEIAQYKITVTEAEKKKLVDAYKKQQEAAEKAAKESKSEAPAAKTDEELAKMVEDQLTNDYEQAAVFRFEKDARNYCVKKANLSVPEKFLRRWLIVANEGKFTEEQIDKDFAGFIEDYKWQIVMNELSKQFKVKVEEKDLTAEAMNFARYQYSMYGLNNVPDEMLENFAKSMLQDKANLERLAENVQLKKVIAKVKESVTVKSKKISAEKFRELE